MGSDDGGGYRLSKRMADGALKRVGRLRQGLERKYVSCQFLHRLTCEIVWEQFDRCVRMRIDVGLRNHGCNGGVARRELSGGVWGEAKAGAGGRIAVREEGKKSA